MATQTNITVTFTPCSPAPSGDYNIQYREYGSSGAYTNAGNFSSSPAVFAASFEAERYEGFIRAIVESGACSNVNWSTPEPAETTLTINWGYINDAGLSGTMRILVNGSTVVVSNTTESGSFDVAPGDEITVIVENSIEGNCNITAVGSAVSINSNLDHFNEETFTATTGSYSIAGHSE